MTGTYPSELEYLVERFRSGQLFDGISDGQPDQSQALQGAIAALEEVLGINQDPTLESDILPICIEDERMWQINGAIEQYLADGMADPAKRSKAIQGFATGMDGSVEPADEKALRGLHEAYEDERIGYGCVTVDSKAALSTVVAALAHVWIADKTGGLAWVFEPDRDLIDSMLSEFSETLEALIQKD